MRRQKFRGTGVPPVIGPPASPSTSNDHGRDGHATKFRLAALKSGLKPYRLHWFPSLGSTSTHAAKLRRERRLVAPAIVLTGRQTAGRGRGANVWRSPPGVVTITFALPPHDTLPPEHVPLVAGLVVRDVAAEFGVTAARIKWPNDVWVGDKKLAGLLCERIDRLDLIGVGLNVELDPAALPPELAGRATSIAREAGVAIDRTDVVLALARRLRETFADARTSLAALLPRLQTHDALNERRVRVSTGDEAIVGTAAGLDADGRLRVRDDAGRIRCIVAGSVALA